MREDTVQFLAQCIRSVRAFSSALDKFVRHTPRAEMSEELGQVARVVRIACAAADSSLSTPRQPEVSAAQSSVNGRQS